MKVALFSVKMDDDLEDELMYELIIAHIRIFSRGYVAVQDGAVKAVGYSKDLSYLLAKPETIILTVCFFLGILLLQGLDLWSKSFINKVKSWTNFYPTVLKIKRSVSASDSEGDSLDCELKFEDSAVYAIKGRREKMEDRFLVVDKLCNMDLSLLAVFDGHGGEFASEFVKNQLLKNIKDRLANLDRRLPTYCAESTPSVAKLKDILYEEILKVDVELLATSKKMGCIAGTTALVALVDRKLNQLVVANVGDSRGIMCDHKGKAIPLSFDHKPQQLKEEKRIKDAGGYVSLNNGVWRVCGILATSRALGDYPLKDRNLISACADVLTFDLNEVKPQFFLLATDGLWDVVSNEDAVKYIKERIGEEYHGARSLAHRAHCLGSADNITIVALNMSKWKWKKCLEKREEGKKENGEMSKTEETDKIQQNT